MDREFVPLVLDANVIIDLVKLGVLHDVARVARYSFLVVEEVMDEVRRPEQARALQEAIATGIVVATALQSLEEEALLASLKESLGAGEAACLAVAHHRKFLVASDETQRKFMREVRRLIGEDNLVRSATLLAKVGGKELECLERLDGAVAALAATAANPRDREEVAHLERVVGRVRNLLRGPANA